jgi:hypothetical protein
MISFQIAEKEFELANTSVIEFFIAKNTQYEEILEILESECKVLLAAFEIQIAAAHRLQKENKEQLCIFE